ncbi:hypothetical protein [Vibrio sonorensis]|uniref:hypothetical protein n=1 Tax=Vibrio sonorensis TaxID=1004316 RepID=UPI0008DAEDE9|nr:hypothetical protein [Vibrio sonorensis]
MEIKIETKVSPDRIEIEEKHDGFALQESGLAKQERKEVIDLKDKAVTNALVALGWTSPESSGHIKFSPRTEGLLSNLEGEPSNSLRFYDLRAELAYKLIFGDEEAIDWASVNRQSLSKILIMNELGQWQVPEGVCSSFFVLLDLYKVKEQLRDDLDKALSTYGDNWYDGFVDARDMQRKNSCFCVEDCSDDEIREMSEHAEEEYLSKISASGGEQCEHHYHFSNEAQQ